MNVIVVLHVGSTLWQVLVYRVMIVTVLYVITSNV